MLTFLEKRETQKQLVLVLAILIVAFIIWQVFSFIKKPVLIQEPFRPAKEVEIDFKILENSLFAELQTFEEIKPFEAGEELKIGRENPFTP